MVSKSLNSFQRARKSKGATSEVNAAWPTVYLEPEVSRTLSLEVSGMNLCTLV